MNKLIEKLSMANFSLREVVVEGSVSTIRDDEETLVSFLSDPVGYLVVDVTDDQFDRLLEERLNPVGASLVFAKIVSNQWNGGDDFDFSVNWLLRTLVSAIDSDRPSHFFSKKVVDAFSILELSEINVWLATELHRSLREKCDMSKSFLEAHVAVLKLIERRFPSSNSSKVV